MGKPHEYACTCCGTRWIGQTRVCPNGCVAIAKSEGEFTKKTFQGSDNDLKKSGR
jgi:hypothetical protein